MNAGVEIHLENYIQTPPTESADLTANHILMGQPYFMLDLRGDNQYALSVGRSPNIVVKVEAIFSL